MKTLTERAAVVLQQVDAAIAMADKATLGPWRAINGDSYCSYPTVVKGSGPHFIFYDVSDVEKTTAEVDVRFPGMDTDAQFVAASRTGWPTALRCLKTTIDALVYLSCYSEEANECGCCTYAQEKLTTLCEQWENNHK